MMRTRFGSLVILDVARCYLWLFTLYIIIKIGKNHLSADTAAHFAFRLCFIRFVFLFPSFVSGEPMQKQGRGLVDHKLVQAPQ